MAAGAESFKTGTTVQEIGKSVEQFLCVNANVVQGSKDKTRQLFGSWLSEPFFRHSSIAGGVR